MILADLKDKCQSVGHVAGDLLRLSDTSNHLCIDDYLRMTHSQHHIWAKYGHCTQHWATD